VREGKGQGGRGRGEEVDSDAQLKQGRRLAKAGPGCLSFTVSVCGVMR